MIDDAETVEADAERQRVLMHTVVATDEKSGSSLTRAQVDDALAAGEMGDERSGEDDDER